MNFSYWERQFISDKADLVVLGAGITGLSTAYFAAQKFPKWKIIVLEKFSKSTAASTRNAGFSCFGSAGEILDDLKNSQNEDDVFSTVKMRYEGLQLMKNILGKEKIEYSECGGMELFNPDQDVEVDEVLSKLDFLNSSIFDFTGTTDTFKIDSIPAALKGFKTAIFNKHEGKLNPGLMLRAWRELCTENNVEIHFGAEAKLDSDFKGVFIQNHYILSHQIAVCTNGLTSKLGLNIDVKPARNLILLTKRLPSLDLESTYHHQKGYFYFRKIHERLLIGGGRHLFENEEFSSEFMVNEKIKSHLLAYLKHHFGIDHNQIEHEWTGIMGVSKSKNALVKRLNSNLICGVRLGGMGIAIGSLVGKKTAELL